MRRTKIVCSIGPASREPEMLRQLVEAGMDVARLNLSHGSRDEHAEDVERIRTVEGGVLLEPGTQVTFVNGDVVGRSPDALPVQNENFASLVTPGERVLLDDGMLLLRVESIEGGVRSIAGLRSVAG